MESLTLALQHELGIADLVPTFGPGTMQAVRNLEPIGVGWDENPNIVRIAQHALFCKGYWGANTYGEWDEATTFALTDLRLNMGLPDGTLPPFGSLLPAEVFQGLLNMDAYVLVAGGSEKIRSIQQWLNGGYWQIDAYVIGPCDGIYSRSVQQSLMIALQYEMGIPTPNGNFGPATQQGLQDNQLAAGDTGVFVELFSAACVFNEPVPEGDTRSNQRSEFDEQLVEFVRAFQSFSELDVNGLGDYRTWAQLLVSMGDPERPVTGCDTRFEITPERAQWLYENGYRAVGRYLNDPPGSTLDKDIKPGELDVIFGAGLRVMPIFQENARLYEDFTFASGFEHAVEAHDLAVDYGFNRGTVIYFAVDYDATQDAIDSAIIPYFNGVVAGLRSRGGRYVHGVYGSRNVCINVSGQTLARYSFVSSMSWGFSGNLGYPLPANWSFNQIKEWQVTELAGPFDLDNNVWREDVGDPGASSVNRPVQVAEDFITYVRELYDCALEYGQGDPSKLVMEFTRSGNYGGWQWQEMIGEIDEGFVDFAMSQGMRIMTEFVDPVTGYEVGAEHLMASCDGAYTYAPPSDPEGVNEGDVAGWGGDLLTFYVDWRRREETYASAYEFTIEHLGVPGVETTFGFANLIEDADSFNLARSVQSGTNIASTVASYYSSAGSSRTRFSEFYEGRFQDLDTAEELAYQMLVESSNTAVGLARLYFILIDEQVTPPWLIPEDNLRGMCRGFAEILRDRARAET